MQNFRVLVNSGTSCYGTNLERVQQRGTAAHNTVTVNDLDSSQVWSGFRVAKRAYPFDFHSVDSRGNLTISCSHGGYKRLKDSVIHQRSWNFFPDSMTITDKLIGNFESAKAHYFFHPDIHVSDNSNSFVLTLPNHIKCVMKISGGEATLVETVWNPEFGKSVASTGLVIAFTEDKIDCSISGYT